MNYTFFTIAMETEKSVDTPVVPQTESIIVEEKKAENNEEVSVESTKNSVEIPVNNGFQVKFLSLSQVEFSFSS